MNAVTEKALLLWGMEGANCELVAARENRVFRVDHNGARHALRLHRKGLRSDDELRSELQWMAAADEGGLFVPSPIPASDGALLHVVDGVQVDMLTWLRGAPLGATGEPLVQDDRAGIFRAMGREMARLHEISDKWVLPTGFSRWAWDREGLVGEAPLWDRFWENPALSAAERAVLVELREAADQDLKRLECRLDYGLIHADFVRENVMVDGNRLQIIDFDDGGFGYRLFDIATALRPNLDERDFEELKAALLEGYGSVRRIDFGPLELFRALRAASYVGWIISRMEEEGAKVRNRRFIDMAVALGGKYLSGR